MGELDSRDDRDMQLIILYAVVFLMAAAVVLWGERAPEREPVWTPATSSEPVLTEVDG